MSYMLLEQNFDNKVFKLFFIPIIDSFLFREIKKYDIKNCVKWRHPSLSE